jgi:hypothetical protein
LNYLWIILWDLFYFSRQDRNGKLATGAIANLVDEGGAIVAQAEGIPFLVSVDMSISFLSTANVNVSAILSFQYMKGEISLCV